MTVCERETERKVMGQTRLIRWPDRKLYVGLQRRRGRRDVNSTGGGAATGQAGKPTVSFSAAPGAAAHHGPATSAWLSPPKAGDLTVTDTQNI